MTAVNTMTELINRELGKAFCFFYPHFIRLYKKKLFFFAIAAQLFFIWPHSGSVRTMFLCETFLKADRIKHVYLFNRDYFTIISLFSTLFFRMNLVLKHKLPTKC
jgi:hypothetical protein